eukprot:c35291_g1_i1 orf=35-238(+)
MARFLSFRSGNWLKYSAQLPHTSGFTAPHQLRLRGEIGFSSCFKHYGAIPAVFSFPMMCTTHQQSSF